jgi:hypothetical protein
MTIDYKDWRVVSKPLFERMTSEPEYRMVEQSAAWQQLTGWLTEEKERKINECASLINDLQRDGDYSHEGLIKKKVRIDICQAEVLLLSSIEQKVLGYSKEDG